jgi:hypothetical protein
VKQGRIIRNAEASAFEKTTMTEADQVRFLAKQKIRSSLSTGQEWRLLRQAVDAVRGGQALADAYHDYERQRRDLLALQIVLTDFRLYWEAIGDALAGREKIIIDAEKVPGKRTLLLFDPDQWRVPVPMIVPDRRSMRERNPRSDPEERQ